MRRLEPLESLAVPSAERCAGNSGSADQNFPVFRAPPPPSPGTCRPAGERRSLDFRGERIQRSGEALRGVDNACREGHFGGDPRALLDAAAAEVAPVGREVLTDRDVERAAVGQRFLLLEDALAKRVGADDRRAVMILQRRGDDLRGRGGVVSTSTTTGIEGAIGWPVARSVSLGWVRPRVVTIVPFAMKMLAISCASSTRPPPLARRSSTIPRAPSCSSRCTALANFAVRPGAERRERDHAELHPMDGPRLRGDDRLGDHRARDPHRVRVVLERRPPWPFDLSVHIGARRPLDQRRGRIGGETQRACGRSPPRSHRRPAAPHAAPARSRTRARSAAPGVAGRPRHRCR